MTAITSTLTSIRRVGEHLPARRLRLWLAGIVLAVVVLVLRTVWMPDAGAAHAGNIATLTALLVFLAAMACEYVDSSLGMGYGTTLTPMLLLAGFAPLDIVPAILLSEFLTGLAAGVWHHRDGNVNFFRDQRARNTALLLAVLSVVGTVAAATLAITISKHLLTGIIAVMLLGVGVMIVATRRRQLAYRRGHIIALGAVAAFNKGLSGGGYGPLVTGGQVVSGVAPKHAVAITSLAESFTCLVGLIAYALMSRSINFELALPLCLGALLSVPMATLTVRKMPESFIRSSVGVVTCLLGLLTLYKALS